MCRSKKIDRCIHEKGYRGNPLTKRQQQRNRKKSRISARVEHIFGFMTNSMNEMYEVQELETLIDQLSKHHPFG